MSGVEDVIVGVLGGTPTGSNTITLFNSFTAFKGVPLSVCGLHRLSFASKNDQAYTLRMYELTIDGATADQIGGDLAVTASAATDVSGPFDYIIDGFAHVRLDLVNGGVTQGTWRPMLTLLSDRTRGT